ncbi:TPA: NfeD family protein [Pseudomonas aeruginosa]
MWHWLFIGVGLLIVEALLGSGYVLWFGLAAAVVGGLVALFPTLPFGAQAILFAITGLISCLAWCKRSQERISTDQASALNKRGQELVGRQFLVKDPIVDGRGTIAVGDTVWPAEGEDLPCGSRVVVRRLDGIVCLVEKD